MCKHTPCLKQCCPLLLTHLVGHEVRQQHDVASVDAHAVIHHGVLDLVNDGRPRSFDTQRFLHLRKNKHPAQTTPTPRHHQRPRPCLDTNNSPSGGSHQNLKFTPQSLPSVSKVYSDRSVTQEHTTVCTAWNSTPFLCIHPNPTPLKHTHTS